MAKKNRIPDKYMIWIETRKRFHLSHAHIQMARELGLNPKKLGKLVPDNKEQWKLPLPAFIEKIYFKHFGREQPLNVRSIEQIVKDKNEKQEEPR